MEIDLLDNVDPSSLLESWISIDRTGILAIVVKLGFIFVFGLVIDNYFGNY